MNPTPTPPVKAPAPVKPAGKQAAGPAPASSEAKPSRNFTLNSKNLRLVLLATLGLSVALFIAILLLGSSALSKQSKKMVGLKVQSQTADAQLSNLEQAKKQVEKYSYFKDIAKTVIPNDKDQAAAVLEIGRMADEAGIALQSITFPASTLGLTTGTVTQDATSSGAADKAISQAKPVTGIPGLYSLELTITPESDAKTPPDKQITYAKMLDFLSRIEDNRHTAQITDVIIGTTNSSTNAIAGLTFSLKTNIFIKP